MSKDYHKTLRVINLIRAIVASPNNMINDKTFRLMMGDPKKASYHKLKNELTTSHGEIQALLKRETVEQDYHYFLNESYSDLKGADTNTEFVLECYSRLGSLLPEEMQKRLSVIKGQKFQKSKNLKKKFCHVRPIAGKELTGHQKKFLPILINAILSQKEVRITYTNAKAELSTFIFRPLTLCMYRDDLYLLGNYLIDKKFEEKNCKIRRISEVVLLEASFPYPAGWNPQGQFQTSSGIINMRNESCDVQIKVYGVSRLAFKEKNIFNNKLLNENNGDEFDLYEVTCTRYNEFLGQLFVYAQDIEIVDNEMMKQLFVEKAMAAVGRNKSK